MFCLITLLVTLQWQPSLPPFPLSHNFDRLIHEWKLMQHLEICLPSGLPTTEAYFSFQLTFKIAVSSSYHHKMDHNCCRISFSVFQNWIWVWVFVEESVEKGFIDDCVWDSSCRIFLRITENIFQHFTPLNFSYSSTAATKRNTAAIKIILLLEDGSFICFGLRKTSPRDSSRTCRQQSAGNVSGLTYSLSGATSEASKPE